MQKFEVTTFWSDGSESTWPVKKMPTLRWLEDLWLGSRSIDPNGPTCLGAEVTIIPAE